MLRRGILLLVGLTGALAKPMGFEGRELSRSSSCVQEDVANSNFDLSYSSATLVGNKKRGTPDVARYCFAITNAAVRGVNNTACNPAGSQCCNADNQRLKSLVLSTASAYPLKDVRKLKWTLNGKRVPSSTSSKDRQKLKIALHSWKTKSTTATLCVELPENQRCDTIEELCGGAACAFELETLKFTGGSSKKSCCLAGSSPLGCAPGYGAVDSGYSCEACPIGSYQNSTASSPPLPRCTACPEGLTTSGTASSSCDVGEIAAYITFRLDGLISQPLDLEQTMIDAALGALNLDGYPRSGTALSGFLYGLSLEDARRRLAANDLSDSNVQFIGRGRDLVDASPLLLQGYSSFFQIGFAAVGLFTKDILEQQLSESGPFLAFLRNELPGAWFPTGGNLCSVSEDIYCNSEFIYETISEVTSCEVDVCFLLDGSGSISQSDWVIEANVVDGAVRSIGYGDAYVTAVEFSSGTAIHVPPARRDVVDTSILRGISKMNGGTDMIAGIEECQRLLTTLPMAATNHSKAIVLLTDGVPNEDPTSVATAVKNAGTKIITVGVKGSNFALLGSLSSGKGYNFSAEAFNNDIANLGNTLTPVICDARLEGTFEECRTVIGNTPLDVRQEPCNTADPIAPAESISPGESVTYLLEYRHVSSTCRASGDPQCWIRVRTTSGAEGWIPSGSPNQPQTLQCGEAPGQANIGCCEGSPCSSVPGDVPKYDFADQFEGAASIRRLSFLPELGMADEQDWIDSLFNGLQEKMTNNQVRRQAIVTSMATGTNGDVYMTGSFDMRAFKVGMSEEFLNKGALGTTDIFLVKFNSDGVLQHIWTFGGNSYDIATKVVVAGSDVYITGYFAGIIQFGSTPPLESASINSLRKLPLYVASQRDIPGGYSKDAFLAKINGDTKVVEWSQRWGGSGKDIGKSMAIYGNDLYVLGEIGSSNFMIGSKLIPNDAGETFVAKIRADNGGLFWGKSFPGLGVDIALAPQGDYAYFTGEFDRTTPWPGIGRAITHIGITWEEEFTLRASDVYIAKIDGNGQTMWANSFGGDYTDRPRSIKVDPTSGMVYLLGTFASSEIRLQVGVLKNPFGGFKTGNASDTGVPFGPYGGALSKPATFVIKFQPSGASVWANTFYSGPNQNEPGGTYGAALALDAAENIYIFGDFNGPALLFEKGDKQTGIIWRTYNSLKRTNDLFLIKLNKAGTVTNARAYGGTGSEYAGDMILDSSKEWIWMAGTFAQSQFKIGQKFLTQTDPLKADVFYAKQGFEDIIE